MTLMSMEGATMHPLPSRRNKFCLYLVMTLLLLGAGLFIATVLSLQPIERSFHDIISDSNAVGLRTDAGNL